MCTVWSKMSLQSDSSECKCRLLCRHIYRLRPKPGHIAEIVPVGGLYMEWHIYLIWYADATLRTQAATYRPGTSSKTHGVGHTTHPRGKVEVVIIVVDHACSPAPQRTIVRIIILSRPVAAHAEIEAVVASAAWSAPPRHAVAPVVALATVSPGILAVLVSVSLRAHLERVGALHRRQLQ